MCKERMIIMREIMPVLALVLCLVFLSAGCSKSDKPQITIPGYPGAQEDQEHNAEIMGMSMGTVKRVITDDSFDKVFAYYKEQLEKYDPEVMSHTLDDGRQAAFTLIKNEKKSLTVAVQEFKEEGKVAITFMRLGFK
jgi:major membrane immunogen (membrane-anchored lipoprotein)